MQKHYPAQNLNSYNLREHMNNNNNNCTNNKNSNMKVNNLDLINNCMDNDSNFEVEGNSVNHNGHVMTNRQMRRLYGNSPFNRHETKL